MQVLLNILIVIDTLLIGVAIWTILTAKTVGESREKKSVTGKNPVKAAFEFEVTPVVKTKRQAKVQAKKTVSRTAKKVSG